MTITFEENRGLRLLIFTGVSGSGKTTYMQKLLREHPDYQQVPRTEITGYPLAWPNRPGTQLVVIDELVTVRDFIEIIRLMCRGYDVIAASHLSRFYHFLLQSFWKAHIVYTDRDPATIYNYLAGQGITCSEPMVRDFCAVFGASYVDARIVLEHHPDCSFDRAWSRFRRTSVITRVPQCKISKQPLQAET